MCTQDGNTKKDCCIPSDTNLGIFSVPDHPGYLVRWKTTPWDHTLWCDDLHLFGAYVCLTTQGGLFFFPKPYFKGKQHIIFVGLFIKICNTPPFPPKYNLNLWLYSTLTKAEFNVTFPPQNQHLDGENVQVHGYFYCIL